MSKIKPLLIFIFLIGLALRLYGLNWDQNNHLHPDERFLTMVETTIKLPSSLHQYLDTQTSPLNPYNYKDYQFFVYGTFPIFLTKIVGYILNLNNYDQINLVGRALSAVFDSFNIIILFFLSRLIFKKSSAQCLVPSALYAFCVLPLQLSHFFAVDTFLTTFILLTFTLLAYRLFPLAAITYGLALACKISAVYFSPVIVVFLILYFFKTKNILRFILVSSFMLLVSFFVFRFFQPYSFTGLFQLNPQFLANIKTLESFNDPNGYFPPAVQWMSKTKIIFPIQNIIFWGAGIPLTLLFVFSIFKLKKDKLIYLSLFWIILLLTIQGSQFAHTMRYFLPIYPFICLVTGYSLLFSKKVKFLILLHVLSGLAFLNIYSHPQSRVQASSWIYDHLPGGSVLTNEYWDDPLPLYLPEHDPNIYQGIMISPYDPDSSEKIIKLNSQIASANYIIMSSNRLWGSIPKVPNKYPLTTKFYNDLFSQKLNFSKIKEFNSYPGFTLPFLKSCYYFGPTDYPRVLNKLFSMDRNCSYPGIYLRDDTAEEAFTVYDHPKVLIFENKN